MITTNRHFTHLLCSALIFFEQTFPPSMIMHPLHIWRLFGFKSYLANIHTLQRTVCFSCFIIALNQVGGEGGGRGDRVSSDKGIVCKVFLILMLFLPCLRPMRQKNKLIKIWVNWFQNTMSLSSLLLLTTKYNILFSNIFYFLPILCIQLQKVLNFFRFEKNCNW